MIKSELEKEFEEILIDYGTLITKICYYFSVNPDDFKDLRQEVLCNIWKGLGKFRKESKLSTWIYRVCFNSCISYHRKEKKLNRISTDNILNLADDTDSSKEDKYEAMHRMIQKLKYEDRVIILMWLDELGYDEIANLTGLNRNTIATRLKRIKEKLIKMNV